jgi:hypothetical protein
LECEAEAEAGQRPLTQTRILLLDRNARAALGKSTDAVGQRARVPESHTVGIVDAPFLLEEGE